MRELAVCNHWKCCIPWNEQFIHSINIKHLLPNTVPVPLDFGGKGEKGNKVC